MKRLELKTIGSIKIEALTKKYGTPLYVYDSTIIKESFEKIYNAFSSNYKKFKICYSVKVNNNLAILSFLQRRGAGFDCSSKGEIYLASKIKNSFISYVGNYNSLEELEYAFEKNVNMLILDDISLVNKIQKIGIDKSVILGFRINLDLNLKDSSFIHLSGDKSKFGISEKEILKAYAKLKKIGIKKFGIHAMLGSNILKPVYFKDVTKRLMDIIVKLKQKISIEIDYIDIGGGFGVAYAENEDDLDIKETALKVTKTIKSIVKKYNLKEPTLIIEPGRYIMAHSGYLLGKIHAIKEKNMPYVGCDISINSILRIPLFNALHKVNVYRKKKIDKKETVNLCGQICWDGDILRRNVVVPKLGPGDIIILRDVGAYGFCHSNQFNTRERPAEVLIYKGKIFLIREREQVKEFDRLVHIPDFLHKNIKMNFEK